MRTYAYGFPKIGKNREFKRAVEDLWNKRLSEKQFQGQAETLEQCMLEVYSRYVDNFPIGEFSLYDNMLDTALTFGAYSCNDLDEYFELCRGKNALELTKWFNTNYHYLVPEIPANFKPALHWEKSKISYNKFKKGLPYFIGPFTFLKLSKGLKQENFKSTLLKLAAAYKEAIKDFKQVHIDEPAFVMDLTKEEINAAKEAYSIMQNGKTDIFLFTYYDSVDFLKELCTFPVKGIGLDFVNGKENFENIKQYGFPSDKILIAGIVNGRNIWRADIKKAVEFLKELSGYAKNIIISNAGPLYHLPVTLEEETLDGDISCLLSFAKERLYELSLIKKCYETHSISTTSWTNPISVLRNDDVINRIKKLKEVDFNKPVLFAERKKIQQNVLNLPAFPTTTIGSFPQTQEVRKQRADYRTGKITKKEYEIFIKNNIKEIIKLQEEIGLDVLVHGEFERTDMVEFFAEKLQGIATTKNGWVLSYGTRAYRPPIIYTDVQRKDPMTISEISYAQSLTKKPVKGMLTGPVTIIAWSYVREDIPISEVAYQLSLCLQDEIKDYEANGIKIVQIDEPAFKEKAPIKKRNWPDYFKWAVKSFKLASQSKAETQIHTHMCYSEFGDIINEIDKMDFDVISIETSRSKADILEHFKKINFQRQVGLGVWDIHSPSVPSQSEMQVIAEKAISVLPKENFWINPDCGLKTRRWDETMLSLKNLVSVAKKLREETKEEIKQGA